MKITINAELTELSVVTRKEIAYKTSDINVLIELGKDSKYSVREAVASNTATPLGTLEELSKDRMWYVRANVARNSSTSSDILTEMSKRETDGQVLLRVAKNIKTQSEALDRIAKKCSMARVAAVTNPNYKR